MKKTQRKMVLQLLRERPNKHIPVWWFVGERHSRLFGWVLLSHKAPTRLSELYQDGLVDRKRVKGKSGAYYYSYMYKEDFEPKQKAFV